MGQEDASKKRCASSVFGPSLAEETEHLASSVFGLSLAEETECC